MFIILLTLITLSVAHTTLRYVVTENYGDYRPVIPEWQKNYHYANSHGHESVRNYPRTYSGVVNVGNIVYPGQDLNMRRRIDTKFSNQYEYQNNYNQWNRGTGTEKIDNRFEADNTAVGSFGGFNKQNENQSSNPKRPTNVNTEINNTYNNKQQETVFNSNTQRDYLNKDSDKIGQGNVLNYEQTLIKDQSSHSLVNNTEIKTENMFTTNSSDDRFKETRRSGKNSTVTVVNTKVTADNEVTIGNVPSDMNEDRWIWSNGDEDVETTTVMLVDDRAAFDGSGCPNGMVRVSNSCIAPD